MSGILGIWKSRVPSPWQAMLKDLKPLGSDRVGDWHDRSIGLSLGRSQLFNTPEAVLETPVMEAAGCVLVWDGRLDDRDALLAGRAHVTDAELLIEAYRRWGIECLKHLTGEFAFLLWDRTTETLWAGCDIVGGRTIAYVWDGETFLASSRALTLLLHPHVSSDLNPVYVAHTLCNLWAHPEGVTPFRQISRLLPGQALSLCNGKFTRHDVASLKFDRSQPVKPIHEYIDQFWEILNRSTRDRMRSYRPICTTLSGGLDSTTVTVSMLNQCDSIDAFSILSDAFPEYDERLQIRSFLDRYPQVKSHVVDCDAAWALTEPWEQLPIPDDPSIMCTTPMNLFVLAAMQAQGFGTLFNGEWGDALFYTTTRDLARSQQWREVWRSVMDKPRWYSAVWQEFLLPQMPSAIREQWFARWQRKWNPTPDWIRAEYYETDAMQTAIRQTFELDLPSDQFGDLEWSMRSSGTVGSLHAYHVLRSAYQIEAVSPMGDRRFVEFALSLPPQLQTDRKQGKIFLRHANRSTLPHEVLSHPKLAYFDPLKYAGLAQGNRALEAFETLRQQDWIHDIINLDAFEQQLKDYRKEYISAYTSGEPFRNTIANRLYSVLAFAVWNAEVSDRYKNKSLVSADF